MRHVFLTLLAVGLVTGCATTPSVAPVSVEEQIRRDNTQGGELAQHFEASHKLKREVEVSVFLRQVAERLTQSTPELRIAPVGVLIIEDRDETHRCYGLPGNRVYLSSGLLRTVRYENELAAAIAMELGHIQKRHVLNRAEENRTRRDGLPVLQDEAHAQPVFYGPAGLFSYRDEETVQAAEAAVGILYRSGYDPRGLVSLWQRFQQEPVHSPYSPESLEHLLEYTRQVIAQYAPLRNPVVRSSAFVAIRERLKQL